MSEHQRAKEAVIDGYIAALEGDARRVAGSEWGLSVEAAGWPLHVGLAIRDGLLRAQAEVVRAGGLDPHVLLRWNRGLPHARFTETGAGDVWIEADLPLEAVTTERLDRFLGLVVRVAEEARRSAAPESSVLSPQSSVAQPDPPGDESGRSLSTEDSGLGTED